MITLIDPTDFLVDPQVMPFSNDQRADIVGADAEEIATGRYVVYKEVVPKGQVMVVRYITPYAMERTDVGTGAESAQMIDPQRINGFVAFNPLVNGKSPVILGIDMNAGKDLANASNAERIRRSGITAVSMQPWIDSQRHNPLFYYIVNSGDEFSMTFEILPQAASNPLPNPWRVGAGVNRVDFAGVRISGVTMPQALYDEVADIVSGKKKIHG